MTKSEILQHKIISSDEAVRVVNSWKLKGYKTAFTNGCFDILHKGHIKVLTEAAQTANKLIVGLNSDSSVKRLKGEQRPLHTATDRAMLLAALQYVDAVVIFEEDTPIEFIKALRSGGLVKVGDYKLDTIDGADLVLENGGEVVVVPTEPGYATSKIINKIQNI